jgi:tetratricopeptide (TPR) repeat protein
MKARTILSVPVVLLLLFAIVIPARAQAPGPQQTLNQYVADLQKNPNDTALRGKIIALAQTMHPAPTIPEEARGHYVMASTFAEKAKEDAERAKDDSGLKQAATEFERAIGEYKAALLAAPWWADAYKKLAIAQKAANHYDDAVASLNFYLLTQPADARDAQDEIYKLKALKQAAADKQAVQAQKQREAEQKAAAEQQRKQQEEQNLQGGVWAHEIPPRRYELTLRGDRLIGSCVLMYDYDLERKGQQCPPVTWRGEAHVNSLHIYGYDYTGEITQDGKVIILHYNNGATDMFNWVFR